MLRDPFSPMSLLGCWIVEKVSFIFFLLSGIYHDECYKSTCWKAHYAFFSSGYNAAIHSQKERTLLYVTLFVPSPSQSRSHAAPSHSSDRSWFSCYKFLHHPPQFFGRPIMETSYSENKEWRFQFPRMW